MEREEVSEKFNSLPKKYRIIIIANEIEQEIRWIEREKEKAITAHSKKIKEYNETIKSRLKWLNELKEEDNDEQN